MYLYYTYIRTHDKRYGTQSFTIFFSAVRDTRYPRRTDLKCIYIYIYI